MPFDALNHLMEKLSTGDTVAAEAVFLEYEPLLRRVVRRLIPDRLRSKFDSMDIVQSAWGDLLEGFRSADWRFENSKQLRAFLVKVTRNRFLDRYRQQDRVDRNEKHYSELDLTQFPNAHNAHQDTPSQSIQADETWQKIFNSCAEEYRPILLQKKQGATTEEIAKKMGMHPGSVRRILRDLAGTLAKDLGPLGKPTTQE